MEPHWKESVVASHPVVPSVNVRDGVRSRMPDVLGRVRVWISRSHIVLGLARVRVRLVNLAPVPLPLPLSFQGTPVRLGRDC